MSQFYPNLTPALQPPEGVESNFNDPQTLMPASIGISTMMLSLMTLCVCARIFIKSKLVKRHQVEDFFSYLASLGVASYTGVFLYVESEGLSRHQWDILLAIFGHLVYYVNILYCIYGPTALFAKLSVLLQIRRVFTTTSRDAIYWVIMASIVVYCMAYAGLFFSYVFQCWPREAIWDPMSPGRCINSNQVNLVAGILNIISDIEALLLPAWAIWHLNMPIKWKLSVYAVFGVGLIACGIGIAGIYIRVILLSEQDFSWVGSILGILVVAELATVVLVGCFPILPRLYRYAREGSTAPSKPSFESRAAASKRTPRKRSSIYGHSMSTVDRYMSHGMQTIESQEGSDEVELQPNVQNLGICYD